MHIVVGGMVCAGFVRYAHPRRGNLAGGLSPMLGAGSGGIMVSAPGGLSSALPALGNAEHRSVGSPPQPKGFEVWGKNKGFYGIWDRCTGGTMGSVPSHFTPFLLSS